MFKAWPKIPRLENEIYHITEKIDGTNACIILQEVPENHDPDTYVGQITTAYNEATKRRYFLFAQSRTRLTYPADDNFGFASWVAKNAEELAKLGEGYHYGEWWGKGIQRGYNLEEKRFSLFNPAKQSKVCYNVPTIAVVSQENLIQTIQSEIEQLKLGSYAAPGFMNPEGLVIYAEKAKCYWKVIINK